MYNMGQARGDFGDWVLNLPRVEVILASNDVDYTATEDGFGRCDTAPYVPGLAFATNTYSGAIWHSFEYSHGFHLIVPGAGSQELLVRHYQGNYTAAPGGDDSAYKLVTKNHWQAKCIHTSGSPSGSRRGYLVVSPNGTRYYLTEFTTRPTSTMRGTSDWIYTKRTSKGSDSQNMKPTFDVLGRVVFQVLPSKVVDRFGNVVTYEYFSDGNLKRISANDGRRIDVGYYSNGLIKTVTAWPGTSKERTWLYEYSGPWLNRITLPGSTTSQPRQWTFNLAELATINPWPNPTDTDPCTIPDAGFGASGAMEHPMGVTGNFHVSATKQGRADVTYVCTKDDTTDSAPTLQIPRFIHTMSIDSKTLSGPGLEDMTWYYNYSEYPGWYNNHTSPGSSNETAKWIEITDPAGATVKRYFSMVWDATEGQLLKTEYKDSNGAIVRTETRNYAEFGPRMGTAQHRVNSARASNTSRLNSLKIYQVCSNWINLLGCDVYTKTLSNYTVFDQAQTIQKFTSGIPNQDTRPETYTYLNDTSVSAPSPSTTVWVIGLPDTTTVNGTETVDYGYSGGTRQLTSIQEFGVTTAQFGYHGDGTLAWFDDALDHRTTYSNYTLGIPKRIDYADGTYMTLTLNPDGSIDSKTDARGYTTRYGYDVSGRLNLIDYPNNDTVNWADTTINFAPTATSEYGIPADHWRQIVTRGDNQITTYYDGLLRPIITRARDIGGQVIFTTRAFDHAGRTLFTGYPSYSGPNYDPAAIVNTPGIQKTYDALGRLTAIKDTTDSSTTSIDYLADNDKIVTGPRGNRTYYEYQVFDQPAYSTVTRIITAYDDLDDRATTAIDRDILGRMQTVTQSGSYNGQSVSETRRYVYDSRGQLCKRVDPETGQSAFRFDNAGNLIWSATNVGGTTTACEAGVSNTDFGSISASKVVVNQYDNRNRIIATDYPSGTADTCYDYDNNGNLTRIATLNEYSSGCPASGTLTRWDYDYNGLNLLTDETLSADSQSFAISYGYNTTGHRNQITYPTGRVFALAPDGLGRATSVGGLATNVAYHANGAIKEFTYGSGAQYSASQTPEQLPNVLAMVLNGDIARLDYKYDDANNVTHIEDVAVGISTTDMTYDALNRLKTATAVALWGTATYKYDPLGNLRQQVISGGTANYWYTTSNRLDSITGSISRNYAYDSHGNVTADGNNQYDYDLANRLTTVTGTASYLYDGHGRRVKHINLNNGETSYSVYNKAGKRLHQYNTTTNTPEDFVYLGSLTIAKLTGPPVTPPVSSLNISGGPADGDYTVSWGVVANVNQYVLQERKNSGSWQGVYSGSALSYAANNRSAGGWQYRVRACSDEGCGAWATSGTAGVVPKAPSSIATPHGTYTSASYTVSWPASSGATYYTLREQRNGSAWATVQNTSSRSKGFTKSDGDYRYAVRACNDYGCSGYRYGATFTIELPPAVPSGLTGPGTVYVGLYTISWNSVSGAQSYELQERSSSDPSWGTIQNNSNRSIYLSRSGPKTYLYRVRACKTVTCGGWSSTISVYVQSGKFGF